MIKTDSMSFSFYRKFWIFSRYYTKVQKYYLKITKILSDIPMSLVIKYYMQNLTINSMDTLLNVYEFVQTRSKMSRPTGIV